MDMIWSPIPFFLPLVNKKNCESQDDLKMEQRCLASLWTMGEETLEDVFWSRSFIAASPVL